MSETHVGITEYDVVTQSLISHHYNRTADGSFRKALPFPYAWPSELDLMARLVGMTLRERWSD